MTTWNQVIVRGLHLSVCAMVCLGCSGDNKEKDMSDGPLHWRQAEAALKSKDVKTIGDYYTRLSKATTNERTIKFFGDVQSREREFTTLERYIDQICRNKGITPDTEVDPKTWTV